MPRNPHKTPCSVPGCRAWAIRGSDPPRCSAHRGAGAHPEPGPGVGAPPGNQNRLLHGFYATILRPEELADLLVHAADTSLDAEIAITRVALRRILRMLLTGLSPGPAPRPLDVVDYARFSSLAFQGVATVSRLLRARQDIGDSPNDVVRRIFGEVLDGLGEEWGIDL
jgi:hypothetical protein